MNSHEESGNTYHTQDSMRSVGGWATTDREIRSLGLSPDAAESIIIHTIGKKRIEETFESLSPPVYRSRAYVPSESATAHLPNAPFRIKKPKPIAEMSAATNAWIMFAFFLLAITLVVSTIMANWGVRLPYWERFYIGVHYSDVNVKSIIRRARMEDNRIYFDPIFGGKSFINSCKNRNCMVPDLDLLSRMLATGGNEKMTEICEAFARYNEAKADVRNKIIMPEFYRINWSVGTDSGGRMFCVLKNREELKEEDLQNLMGRRIGVIFCAIFLVLLAALLTIRMARKAPEKIESGNF